MRHFVVIGRTATASDDFRLDDLPGSSGRLDVLLRCVRAALLISHGLRRDVVLYLVLGGGVRAPRALRVIAAEARFIRPDERSLATLAKKVLNSAPIAHEREFIPVRPGIALSGGGLEAVLDDLSVGASYLLHENGPDVRECENVGAVDSAFFLGDHLGFDELTRARLVAFGASVLGLGPVSVHAEDAIAIVHNELDRRERRGGRPG